MRRRFALPLALAPALLAGCAARPPKATGTLAQLHDVRPDVQDVKVEQGLDQAMVNYRRFLEETPETALTPEAMRRLADLQIEKQFGIHTGGRPKEMVAPETLRVAAPAKTVTPGSPGVPVAANRESDQDFERRTTAASGIFTGSAADDSVPAVAADVAPGPIEAIALYEKLLTEYPNYEHRDKVLYQMARAYDELGRTEEAIQTMERLIGANPHSEHLDEVQFRRGEYFFTRRRFRDAENAYSSVISLGAHSGFYELALYKLGWTFYKQDLYDEALHKYMALLDYKVSIGYDFDQTHEEEDERRVADTYRVISLSFSNLGGPDAVREYYAANGARTYEDRVYSNLGEHYLGQLRYDDAAKTYKTFVTLHPFHRAAPRFSMRVVDTFVQGGFPKLVLESKRDFASRYGLQSEYWQHFKPEDAPDVLGYLKTNLKDLATHYHAEYQSGGSAEEQLANYREARRWYGDFLDSFPQDAESPVINYSLADLHLENEDFGEAGRQYERTAYEYPVHARAADAGYAAVYAYRQQLKKTADASLQEPVKRAVIASSIRFADAFPSDEHAAPILGAAADDLYELKDYRPAIDAAARVVDTYPGAAPAVRRSALIVVAHGSFELGEYAQAEKVYTQVLDVTPTGDDSRAGFIDNLAASIYKQGELASAAEDYRAAAGHFLRIRSAAPTSTIRAAAEYDAGTALLKLEDWTSAIDVLESFRRSFPEHALQLEAAKQIANAYRQSGQLSRAAAQYEQIATQSSDPGLRSEALLLAGDLYVQSDARERALQAYTRYVSEFPSPVETALETRFKIAAMYKAGHDTARYQQQLKDIVRIDAAAGGERTSRTRTVAARSALVLAEEVYGDFAVVKLRQPFESSLAEKQTRMDASIKAMGQLVDYQIADVTAAATYYMAETYFNFSRALVESERPAGLKPAELEAFEMALDEEAFPFEEKAIGVHEKNIEMLRGGVYNEWTEKSLGKLAELVPGRYAKHETSSRFPGAILLEGDGSGTIPNPSTGDGFGQDAISDDAFADYLAAVRMLEETPSAAATALLAKVTQRAPGYAGARVDLGMAYARSGDLEKAEAELRRALELSAGQPVALNELAMVQRRKGDVANARASYEAALALSPDFPEAQRNLAILCDLYLADTTCALAHYEAYSTLVPEDADVAKWLADLRNRQKGKEKR
jgi:tetratricopeptide (TPR) repeat protein